MDVVKTRLGHELTVSTQPQTAITPCLATATRNVSRCPLTKFQAIPYEICAPISRFTWPVVCGIASGDSHSIRYRTDGMFLLIITFRLLKPSKKGRGERTYDIYSRLLRERVVMLHGPVRIFTTDSNILFIWRADTGRCFLSDGGADSLSGSRGHHQAHTPLHQLSRRQCDRRSRDI